MGAGAHPPQVARHHERDRVIARQSRLDGRDGLVVAGVVPPIRAALRSPTGPSGATPPRGRATSGPVNQDVAVGSRAVLHLALFRAGRGRRRPPLRLDAAPRLARRQAPCSGTRAKSRIDCWTVSRPCRLCGGTWRFSSSTPLGSETDRGRPVRSLLTFRDEVGQRWRRTLTTRALPHHHPTRLEGGGGAVSVWGRRE